MTGHCTELHNSGVYSARGAVIARLVEGAAGHARFAASVTVSRST
jgi:hypothetical protein